MHTRAINSAAGVLLAAMQQGRQTPTGLAIALDAACLLNSPEHAARVAELEADREANDREYEQATARIAELEAEREKLVRWHGEDSKTINRLVARVERRQAELIALRNDALNMRGSLAPADGDRKVPFELGETLAPAVDWLIARVAELEAAPTTVYRASHDSIQMGLYRTAAAARAHCEAMERRAWAPKAPSFDWIEDEEEGIAELTVFVMGKEWQSGYVVTEVPVSAEYDEEADE